MQPPLKMKNAQTTTRIGAVVYAKWHKADRRIFTRQNKFRIIKNALIILYLHQTA